MNLYITRHGETQWNKAGKMQGWKNSDLTEEGIQGAKKLGESLKDINFQCIYSSPQGRALDTAKYIRGDKDIEIVLLDSLKEMGFGLWEGIEHNKLQELYKEEYYNFWNRPELYKNHSGESFQELFKRVEESLNQIIEKHLEGNVLIVCHGVVLKVLYAIIKNKELKDLWEPPFMKNTSLTILKVEGNKREFILEADISHLKEDEN